MRQTVFEYIEVDYNRAHGQSANGHVSAAAFEAKRNIKPMKLASEDLHFLRSLAWALLALAFSAAILLILFVTYNQFQQPERVNSTTNTKMVVNQFTTTLGTSRLENDALVITALETRAGENHALIATHLPFDAQHYPYIRYGFDGLQTGLHLQFFWSKSENPKKMFSAVLPRNVGTTSTFSLGAQPEWQGTISDIALLITGDLRDQPLRIAEITLTAGTWHWLIASVWSEWTAFRGWSASSINNLQGISSYAGSATVSPSIAMAIWAGLALIFLYLIDRAWPMKNLISYVAAILIPWIALDLLWQNELSTQLQETKYLFSGKTTHEKHLVDVDQDTYRYTKRLKEDVLPSSPSRIFILHDSSTHNFTRLKTQYYLLPHNIYNFNRWQPHQQLQPGDYILELGTVPGLSFNAGVNQLSWKSTRLTVKVADRDPRGTLYRVPLSTDITAHPDKQLEHPNG
jgi:hypothetical protein